jgi:hypothetical protein
MLQLMMMKRTNSCRCRVPVPQATNEELERVKTHSNEVEATNEALTAQKQALALNNSRLVITNLMLLNKAKTLEEHSRALVAKQEDLQHQVHAVCRPNPCPPARTASSCHITFLALL